MSAEIERKDEVEPKDGEKNRTLRELRQLHNAHIISQVVDIAKQSNQKKHGKLRNFIRKLEVLFWNGSDLLSRESINAEHEQDYVALSYTWTPSKYESEEPGEYLVEEWDDDRYMRSPVRKCILERVLRYMRHIKVQYLWIDAHCIRQDTSSANTDWPDDIVIEKQNAIQAMDLVYGLSHHPVALLGRPLGNGAELDLLSHILSGKLVDRLSSRTTGNIREARQALSLLREITRDRWWRRAWTFQENYRGGNYMHLLIRHDAALEKQKQRHEVFSGVSGWIPGELCIQSVTFSKEATRLCKALETAERAAASAGLDVRQMRTEIKDVRNAAGRYKFLLEPSHPMTPRIVADIQARDIDEPWDRLAIVANCCQYPVRLDSKTLGLQSHSPSLSVLAMCLLNGEILDNRENNSGVSVADMTASKALDQLMFKKFRAPEDDVMKLTYNQSCRLAHATLTPSGIATKGHLWELGAPIDTRELLARMGRVETWGEWEGLGQLAQDLGEKDHPLADMLDGFLVDNACSDGEVSSADTEDTDSSDSLDSTDSTDSTNYYSDFTSMHLHRMARELENAIRNGEKLRLGRLRHRPRNGPQGNAVFVCSENGQLEKKAFVFTSVWAAKPGSKKYEANDTDSHVSLQVDMGTDRSGGTPQLRVRSWMLGMCFFSDCSRTEVLFPWPRALGRI